MLSRPALRETLLLLAALGLCPLAALLAPSDPALPIARAQALIDLEAGLGVLVEPTVHAWALARPALLDVAGLLYLLAHVAVAGWALIWTWCLRPDRYRIVRDTFLLTQALLIATYVAVPVAPPRLVPGAGFTDTLGGLSGSVHLLQSPYAAVPSGHVAFALIAGATFARLGDMAWLRVFGWAYPPLVVAVTVLTGHHLLFDAVAAAVAVTAAYAVRTRGPAWAARASAVRGGPGPGRRRARATPGTTSGPRRSPRPARGRSPGATPAR